MKKMLSKVLALALVAALGLGLTGGAFAADPQTGTFDLESTCYDYGQLISTVVVNLDTPVGDVTEEEIVEAFSVTVMGYDRNFYGFLIQGDLPRVVTGATVSEDGETVTLELQSTPDDSIVGTTLYPQFSDGYEVKLVSDLGNLTAGLALTYSGKTTDPVADKWAAVPLNNEALTYAYRWFDPSTAGYEMPETGYPVIVWLHGMGEWGSDNNAQLTANRVTAWGEAETQDIFGGAYVLAPQAYSGTDGTVASALTGWNGDSIKNTIESLIAAVGEENVDRNRIVIGGCSMGGAGTITAITTHPDYYAAAFPICAAGTITDTTESTIALLDMPIYFIHSIDDNTVPVGNTITTYNTFKTLGKTNMHLALFEHVWFEGLADTVEAMANYGHWSWVYAHNNFKGEDKYWTPEYTHTDGETYRSSFPSDLGYETFKHWLADQVLPAGSEGMTFTRGREGVEFGEVVTSVTINNAPYRKLTVDMADYFIANPVVVTVGNGIVREPVEMTVDGTTITVKFAVGDFGVDQTNGTALAYKVTVGGVEAAYAGDTSDADAFEELVVTTPEYTWSRRGTTMTSMEARYFVPDKETYPSENGYPLIIWLHGSGEVGSDNRIQITANDVTEWASDESQAVFGGAYVLAPQNHAGAGEGAPAATKSLIDQFIAEMGDVDMNRIYIGGCSYGGGATWTMLKEYPTFFAAGFPVCMGTSFEKGEAEALAAAGTPIYIITSTGDSSGIVSGAINAHNALVAAGHDDVHIALFEHSWFDGYDAILELAATGVLPGLDGSPFLDHWSWVYAHADFDGTGDDHDGEQWIDTKVVGEYNGGAVTVNNGILTYTYTSGTDGEGNPLTVEVKLNGKTERPGEIGDGYATFKTWLAAQSRPQNYISIGKTVEDWGEIVSDVTVTLAEPIGELTAEDVTVEVTMSVFDWATFTSSVQTYERTVLGVTVSEDGLTVELELDNAYTAAGTAAGFMTYKVTLGEVVVDSVLVDVSPDADKFAELTYTVPTYSSYALGGGTTNKMEARYYVPDKTVHADGGDGYPLVVWLHGIGECGTENHLQISANDVPAWTEEDAQNIFGGAYVLAPQNHAGGGWYPGGVEATMNLIDQFLDEMGDIDPTRIYIGGCSYGGMSTWEMIKAYPNFFAAAFPTCGSTALTEEDVALLADLPIYLIHSVDDNTVHITGTLAPYDALTAAGKENVYLALYEHVQFEGLPEAAQPYLGHWSWVYTHNDFDGEGDDELYWLDEWTYTAEDGTETVYRSTKPSALGYATFKTWLAAQTNETPSAFKDVTGETENYAAINALYEAGITNGTGNNMFKPNSTLTRAEFMTFLARAVEATVDNTADTGFTDVPTDSWQTGAIAWGVANELIEGYGDDRFGPNDAVTEEQVNLIIGRLLENISGVTAADGQTIADATDAPATRGQVAAVINAVAENYTAPRGWWW